MSIVKSQKVIDNRKNLMKLAGAVIKDGKVIFEPTTNVFKIIDTETSGLDAKKDRIVQFSGIEYRVENGRLIETNRFDLFINQPQYDPNKIIPGKNGDPDKTFADLTGITAEMLADAPNEDEAFPLIKDFIGDDPIFVGYNTPFDFGMIKEMYLRHSENLIVNTDKMLDVLVMAKDLVDRDTAPVLLNDAGEPVTNKNGVEKKTWKLSYIAELYGLDKAEEADETIRFHSSINDVVVTGRLLNVFINEYKEQIEDELNVPEKIRTRAKVLGIRYWAGYRGYSRFYIDAVLNNKNVSYFFDIRNKVWGEKENGILEETLLEEFKSDVLELAGVKTEDEFVKLTIPDYDPIKADDVFLSRYN